MKSKKVFFYFIFTLFLGISVKAQLEPAGKTYIANTGSTCKMMKGGGCSIDEFCSLSFTKDKVSVFNYTKVSCSPKSRERNYDQKPGPKTIYNWSIINNVMHIENFDKYGNFEVLETKLIGKKNPDTPLEFLKQ